MAIHGLYIDYDLTEDLVIDEREIPGQDGYDFRHTYFKGIFSFNSGINSLTSPPYAVPLLDVSLQLLDISHNIVNDYATKQALDMEGGDSLIFENSGTIWTIETSYNNDVVESEAAELINAVKRFHENLIRDIIGENPAIYRNRIFMVYAGISELLRV